MPSGNLCYIPLRKPRDVSAQAPRNRLIEQPMPPRLRATFNEWLTVEYWHYDGTPGKRLKSYAKKIPQLRMRDGDLCWVCQYPMDFDKCDGGKHLGASVDHIIPLRDDGTNHPSNLRLAHRYCNSSTDRFGDEFKELCRHAVVQIVRDVYGAAPEWWVRALTINTNL